MKLKSISLNLLYKLTSEPVKSDEASKIHKLICRGVHADFEWTIPSLQMHLSCFWVDRIVENFPQSTGFKLV